MASWTGIPGLSTVWSGRSRSVPTACKVAQSMGKGTAALVLLVLLAATPVVDQEFWPAATPETRPRIWELAVVGAVASLFGAGQPHCAPFSGFPEVGRSIILQTTDLWPAARELSRPETLIPGNIWLPAQGGRVPRKSRFASPQRGRPEADVGDFEHTMCRTNCNRPGHRECPGRVWHWGTAREA